MSKTVPVPLYPTYIELNEFELADYPKLNDFISTMPAWSLNQWQWGKVFLEYTGRNKSVHTYDRFRNEIEKFLLWSFLIRNRLLMRCVKMTFWNMQTSVGSHR